MIPSSRKSNPQTATSSRRARSGAAVGLAVMRGFVTMAAFLIAGCHGGPPPEGTLHDERACLLADSLLRESGLTGDFELTGRTTIDVNQYRVRGRFALTVSRDDDVVLEFTSTSPMGYPPRTCQSPMPATAMPLSSRNGAGAPRSRSANPANDSTGASS